MAAQNKKLRQWKSFFGLVIFPVLLGIPLMLFTPLMGEGAPIEIRAHHDSTTTSPWHLGMVRFAELVEKKSNGNLKVKIFPPGQLSQSNIRTTIELLQAGSIHCALIVPGFYEAFDQRFMIFGMPFLFKDREQTFRVLDGPLGEKMLAMMSEKGIKGVEYWDHGYRQITNSKRPIRVPEDLRGLRIRTPLSPVIGSIFKTLGSTTTATAMGELYMALQQKMVDGQENPYNTIYRRKFYEAQKYITEWNYQFSPLFVGMNLAFYKGLSPEFQKIVMSAAAEAATYQRKLSADEDDQMKKELLAKGMELTILNKEQLAAFQKAMDPVYKEFEPQMGKELMQEFLNALK
ncbi:MAG: TRAP transporter substrate-binding protein [Thermodesulfobacteriota bacterium]|nr:TRAP transporter substrate-binding protein [Thermodesulfobacteriota bacterium]